MRIPSLLFQNCLIVIIITCKKKNFISSLSLKRKPLIQHIVSKNQSLKWFTSVKWLSIVRLFATSWTAERQAFLSITISQSLPKLMSNEYWHPTVSSSAVPFSSHLQSFPASGSFEMSQFLTSGGQSIGVSGSTSVLPKNTQD